MKGIILGAGFTGMAAGIKTGWPIYEMKNTPGGICRSYIKDGYQFEDGGGHWIFGKGEGLEYMKSLVELKTYERRAGVYYNTIFPYPFQTSAQEEIQANEWSMKGWLRSTFSKEECNLFFNPFNEKYTAGLYDNIIQYDEYKTPPAGSKGFVSTFHDPVDGLSSLVDKMAEKCNIHYGRRVLGMDTERKEVYFSDGKVVEYDQMISTIPLDQLLMMCGKTDFDLPRTSVLVLNIGAAKGVNLPNHHWLYIPFCKSGFYRIGFYSNVEEDKAPTGKVGIWVEMALRDVSYTDLDIEAIEDEVVEELQRWGFIGEVDVVDPTWVPCAYTWMRSISHRDEQLKWLKERDIISIGRYGRWHFCGMTQSIEMGFKAAEEVLNEVQN